VSINIVFVIGTFIPLIVTFLPDTNESFVVFAVLGRNEKAKNYFPGEDPNIGINEKVEWNLYLHNDMSESQYIIIAVKIANSTISPPSAKSCIASPALKIYQIREFIFVNETKIIPFSWNIVNVSSIEEFRKLEKVSINDEIIEVNAKSRNGYNFRIIFELWIFDKELEEFQFDWRNGSERRCVWTQVWFNSTTIN
jgi:uncharacterized membrane protein